MRPDSRPPWFGVGCDRLHRSKLEVSFAGRGRQIPAAAQCPAVRVSHCAPGVSRTSTSASTQGPTKCRDVLRERGFFDRRIQPDGFEDIVLLAGRASDGGDRVEDRLLSSLDRPEHFQAIRPRRHQFVVCAGLPAAISQYCLPPQLQCTAERLRQAGIPSAGASSRPS
jgi:hypothetical protein